MTGPKPTDAEVYCRCCEGRVFEPDRAPRDEDGRPLCRSCAAEPEPWRPTPGYVSPDEYERQMEYYDHQYCLLYS